MLSRLLFTTYWWIAICPICLLTLTVLAFKMMLEGYQNGQKALSDRVRKESEENFEPLREEERFERVRRSV